MPPTQLTCFSDEFVISAGCVLFRFQDGKEEICVLHQRKKDEWVLPKGRKDRGESVEITALRETYEETGYRCRYLPTDLYTRAPIAGLSMNEEATEAKGSTSEPFAVSIRDADESGRIKKIVWWFIAEVVGEHQKGTQMPTEDFESVFLNADEAIIKLTRETDRDAVKRAVGLVRRTRTNCQLEKLGNSDDTIATSETCVDTMVDHKISKPVSSKNSCNKSQPYSYGSSPAL